METSLKIFSDFPSVELDDFVILQIPEVKTDWAQS